MIARPPAFFRSLLVEFMRGTNSLQVSAALMLIAGLGVERLDGSSAVTCGAQLTAARIHVNAAINREYLIVFPRVLEEHNAAFGAPTAVPAEARSARPRLSPGRLLAAALAKVIGGPLYRPSVFASRGLPWGPRRPGAVAAAGRCRYLARLTARRGRHSPPRERDTPGSPWARRSRSAMRSYWAAISSRSARSRLGSTASTCRRNFAAVVRYRRARASGASGNGIGVLTW